MIWFGLGRWSSATGRWFSRDRLYWKGYRWTPICTISRRIQPRAAFVNSKTFRREN